MRKFQESVIRTKLAHMPATKLFIKIFFDLMKFDFLQMKHSIWGFIETLKCHITRIINNKKQVECNYCGWTGNIFYPHVTTAGVMKEEKCPNCGSIPRYRTLMNFLHIDYKLFQKKIKILEIGPNRSLQDILINNPNFDYTSVDLKSPQAMLHMDVTDLKFEDSMFDMVLCIGVMHYVEDDIKGFREIFRVLKPGGDFIFGSGIDHNAEKTVEFERAPENCYTVRLYGWDVLKKIENVGFKYKVYKPVERYTEEEVKKYGLSKHAFIWAKK